MPAARYMRQLVDPLLALIFVADDDDGSPGGGGGRGDGGVGAAGAARGGAGDGGGDEEDEEDDEGAAQSFFEVPRRVRPLRRDKCVYVVMEEGGRSVRSRAASAGDDLAPLLQEMISRRFCRR